MVEKKKKASERAEKAGDKAKGDSIMLNIIFKNQAIKQKDGGRRSENPKKEILSSETPGGPVWEIVWGSV